MRAYILVGHVIDGEKWLNDLGRLDVSYHSETPFEKLMMDTQPSVDLG